MSTKVKEKNLAHLLEEVKKRNKGYKGYKGEKKTLADIFGKLKRGLDGLEYQKAVRNGEGD